MGITTAMALKYYNNNLGLCMACGSLMMYCIIIIILLLFSCIQYYHYYPNTATKKYVNYNVVSAPILDIPTVNIQDFDSPTSVLNYLQQTFGNDWRNYPLLLKNIWTQHELQYNNNNGTTSRKLSIQGLLQEPLPVPYFTNAKKVNALIPDAIAPIQDIVANITYLGMPHKIGTQLLLQHHPELLSEVAPLDLVTLLFGNYFHVDNLFQPNSNTIKTKSIIPGTLTVPLFVSSSSSLGGSKKNIKQQQQKEQEPNYNNCNDSDETIENDNQFCYNNNNEKSSSSSPPPPPPRRRQDNKDAYNNDDYYLNHTYTPLHAEPIGNVAVQLYGSKHWTLIDPKYSHLLDPVWSPDGRAFVAATVPNYTHVPRYELTTHGGDAVWVPTWTWHQVDYQYYYHNNDDENLNNIDMNHKNKNNDTLCIGASLFHFRLFDLFRRQPWYAIRVIPRLIMELVGKKTQ